MDFTEKKLYQQTILPVEDATTLIPEAYTSPDFYTIEQKRIFSNRWVAVACISELKSAGDVLVTTVAQQSILITRNEVGQLHDLPL